MSLIRLKVVVSTYNALPYLERCLRSIERQRYRHFDLCVVDDCSTQAGQRELIKHICSRNGWSMIFQEKRGGPLASRVCGIASFNASPDDIFFLVDGDDWLYDDKVFGKVAAVYRSGRYDLTYGQHIEYPRMQLGGKKPQLGSKPTPRRVVRNRSYRSHRMSWFHPWTFRYFLWQSICDSDLRDLRGEYFRTATDFAFFYPLLEMAGKRVYCFSDLLYVHNRDNPINESKVVGVAQVATAFGWLGIQPPYEVHERCR